MADLYDEHGNPITIPDEQVRERFLAGKVIFPRGSKVPISYNGEHFGHVPAEEAEDAFSKGWSFDPMGVANAHNQRVYGTPGQMAKTAVEQAISGATAGISEPIEAGLGIATPEAIEGRKAANPITAGVSGVAGAVAPAFLGDELGPVGLITRAGEGVEEAVAGARAIPKIAEGVDFIGHAAGAPSSVPAYLDALKSSVTEAPSAGRALAGSLARGATEAGLYGATEEVSKQILEGDDSEIPVRAQKVLASGSLSALVGGGASGVFHLAGAVGSGLFGKALDAFAPKAVGGPAIERGTLEAAVDAVATKAEEDPTTFGGKILDALVGKDRRAALGRLANREVRNLARTAESDANGQYIAGADALNDFIASIDTAGEKIRDVVKPKDVAAGLANVDPILPRSSVVELVAKIRARAAEMEAAPADFFGSSKIGELRHQADKLEASIGKMPDEFDRLFGGGPSGKLPTAEELWKTLNEAKKNLEVIQKINDSVPASERPAAMVAGDFRKEVQGLLENRAVWGDAASAQAKYNEIAAKWLGARDRFFKQFGEREGYAGGKMRFTVGEVESFFKQLGEPGNEMRRRAFVEMMQESTGVSSSFLDDAGLQATIRKTYGKTQDLAKLSRAFSDLRKARGKATAIEGLFASPIGRAVMGGIIGGPAGALGGAAAPKVGSAIVHLLDTLAERNSSEIRSLAKSIARGTRPVGGAAPIAAAKILSSIRFSDRVPKPTKNARESFTRVAGEIQALAADPAGTQAMMRSKVAPIAKEAPRTANQMVNHGMSTLRYIISQMPPPMPRSVLVPPAVGSRSAPSDSDIATFAKVVQVAQNPMVAFEDLAHGRLSMTAARTLRATNPELFREMGKEVLKAVEESGKPVPYAMRLQVGLFLGAPTDPSLNPVFIHRMQSMYSPPAPAGGNMPLKTTKDLKSIKMAASAAQKLEKPMDVAT